ncbi:MAG: hypothetical protein ACPGNV_06800 [Mangrovicoccus sp.]
MSAGAGIQIAKAKLKPVTDGDGRELSEADKDAQAITVQFNPENLDIKLKNNFKPSKGDNPVQLVDDATAQLSFELHFDTTESGQDVRQLTDKVAGFLKPTNELLRSSNKKKLPKPKVVEFDWGAILFQGYMDSYSEKIDYFSAEGVPLRAKLNISLTQQERSFDPKATKAAAQPSDPFSAGAVSNSPDAAGAVETDQDPSKPLDNAAAAANGAENARRPGLDSIALPDADGPFAQALSEGFSTPNPLGAPFDEAFGGALGDRVDLSEGPAGAFAGLSRAPVKLSLKPVSLDLTRLPATTPSLGKAQLGGALRSDQGDSLCAKITDNISFDGD